MHPPWRWSGSRGIEFDSQSAVHGNPERLAFEVAFRWLDGAVAKQVVNLIQFAACEMAETRTRLRIVVEPEIAM